MDLSGHLRKRKVLEETGGASGGPVGAGERPPPVEGPAQLLRYPPENHMTSTSQSLRSLSRLPPPVVWG